MKYLLEYKEFKQKAPRHTKTLKDMHRYRRFNGDLYREQLLPKFRHLNQRWGNLKLPEWFEKVQQYDDMFYMYVFSGEIGQPDVRELWRDLTGRPDSKLSHVLNPILSPKIRPITYVNQR